MSVNNVQDLSLYMERVHPELNPIVFLTEDRFKTCKSITVPMSIYRPCEYDFLHLIEADFMYINKKCSMVFCKVDQHRTSSKLISGYVGFKVENYDLFLRDCENMKYIYRTARVRKNLAFKEFSSRLTYLGKYQVDKNILLPDQFFGLLNVSRFSAQYSNLDLLLFVDFFRKLKKIANRPSNNVPKGFLVYFG